MTYTKIKLGAGINNIKEYLPDNNGHGNPGVSSHPALSGREIPDAHPISAITGLEGELTSLQNDITAIPAPVKPDWNVPGSILNKPTIPVTPDWNVAGSILNKPTIPVIPTNLVIDPNYIHTDNNFDLTQKNKLNSLTPQVNADYNAVGGSALILNKPTIPEDYAAGILSGNSLKCDKLYIYPSVIINSQVIYSFDFTGAINTKGGEITFIADGVAGHEPVFSNGKLSSGEFNNVNGEKSVLAYVFLGNGLVSYSWIYGKDIVDAGSITLTQVKAIARKYAIALSN